MGRIVAAAAYSEGHKVADIALADGRDWAERPRHFVWIGIHEPNAAELKDLQRQFGLHELAIEDALQAHQRPKIETFGDKLFIVLRTAQRQAESVAFGETHIFVGQGYVISVRHGPSTSYAQVRARCEARPALLRHGEDFVLHAIMDFVVDNYFPVVEAIQAEVTEIEDTMLGGSLQQQDVERIHRLRRELLKLRQAVAPTAVVCRQIEHLDVPFIDEKIKPYFRDVADHVQQVNELIGTLQELLDHAFETGLLLESSRQNVVQRKFAAWAAILACPTAIAGIYGMNFENIPELHLEYGYFIVIAVILGLCTTLYVLFRRSGWL